MTGAKDEVLCRRVQCPVCGAERFAPIADLLFLDKDDVQFRCDTCRRKDQLNVDLLNGAYGLNYQETAIISVAVVIVASWLIRQFQLSSVEKFIVATVVALIVLWLCDRFAVSRLWRLRRVEADQQPWRRGYAWGKSHSRSLLFVLLLMVMLIASWGTIKDRLFPPGNRWNPIVVNPRDVER